MSDRFWYDRGDRLRMVFAGAQAKAALHGLVTHDIVALRPGAGLRAAALTPKGKLLAIIRVFDRGTDLLVDCERSAADGFAGMIRKYVNPRLAAYRDVSQGLGCLAVHGEDAHQVLHAAIAGVLPDAPGTAAAFAALAPLAGVGPGQGEPSWWIVRTDELPVDGYEVFAAPAVIASLRESLTRTGLREAGADTLEPLRLARGLPRFGVEVDGDTLPQEALLDAFGAIAFDKGCYTGQEVVARIHFRGHVNRHLRWLRSARPLVPGARVRVLRDGATTEVGDVRSAASTPAGALAVAMVRREVEPGAEVLVDATAGGDVASREPHGETVPATVEAITTP